MIPPVFGLQGVGFETFNADGPISYWNNYVAVTQMGGHGSFSDPRIGVIVTQTPDLVTPKLPALLAVPIELADSFAAGRKLQSRGREARRGSVCGRGGMRDLPQATTFTDV